MKLSYRRYDINGIGGGDHGDAAISEDDAAEAESGGYDEEDAPSQRVIR